MKQKQYGFTLIEIAIVLVIIGLLLGGILKGQELITSARVRNMISQQDGVKAAYFGFQDRYRSLPGDYPTLLASQNIPNETVGCAGANCQDGRINDGGGSTESIIAWSHLSKAGFINGNYNGAGATPAATNSPTNPYGSFVQLIFDATYDPAASPAAVNFKTGTGVPASILAEIDRKIDDGAPTTGIFRSSQFGPPAAGCTVAGPPVRWDASTDVKNCGGAAIF
ncbi:MAG TPA: prepilin-type N-terminal cleavage/methylation domain-containing protein [Burkholderiales bacterium]|nr:prepilin-type N-terminal cleavage/methylation domain-containing protein [Burkholderiales bacterium]